MIDTSPAKRKRRRVKSAEVTLDVNTIDFRCVCGETMAGQRAEQTQITACPRCDRLHYLLPQNLYPEPKKGKAKKKRKAGQTPAQQAEAARKALYKRAQIAGRGVMGVLVAARLRVVSALLWMRRQLTPLRLISTAIVLVVALTLGYGFYAQRQSAAKILFNESWTKAQPLLAAGDIDAADPHLQLAIKALNRLQPGDTLERQVRQLAKESYTSTHLSITDLLDVAKDAQSYRDNGNLLIWPSRFERMYRGNWMLFDLQVRNAAASLSEPARYEFASDLIYEKRPIVIAGELPFLKNLVIDAGWHRVIFAAQLSEWTSRDDRGWDVRLNQETAFLWCHRQTLPASFNPVQVWETEAEVDTLLSMQAEAMQVEPANQLLAGQTNTNPEGR